MEDSVINHKRKRKINKKMLNISVILKEMPPRQIWNKYEKSKSTSGADTLGQSGAVSGGPQMQGPLSLYHEKTTKSNK